MFQERVERRFCNCRSAVSSFKKVNNIPIFLRLSCLGWLTSHSIALTNPCIFLKRIVIVLSFIFVKVCLSFCVNEQYGSLATSRYGRIWNYISSLVTELRCTTWTINATKHLEWLSSKIYVFVSKMHTFLPKLKHKPMFFPQLITRILKNYKSLQ